MGDPYSRDRTAVLLVDPYNDFFSEGGKLYPLLKEVAVEVHLLDNLREILATARAAGIAVVTVPHRRWRSGDRAGWKRVTPYQSSSDAAQVFELGTWGAEWHPDLAPRDGELVVQEHRGSSGFASTDLDLHLRQRGIERVILIGAIANTCLESTGRYAMELGYHVTLVTDATAAFSRDAMRASHQLNGPTFAHAILSTRELIAALRDATSQPADGA